MSIIKNEVCEFCGRKRKWLSSNGFHGHYCTDCLKLSRKEDARCLNEIKDEIKKGKVL